MKAAQRIYLASGILIFGLGMAKPSFAITGCTNAYLTGAYNAQITNIAFENVINNLNAAAGATGVTGTTGTTGATGTTGTTGVAALPGGLGGNSSSINGNVPGLGRFLFDGNGNIYGVSTGSSTNAPSYMTVGSYNVSGNCTATLTLNTGQHYNAVIVDQGNQVLFLQSDTSGNGATGVLQRSATSCVASQYPQSFGFELLWCNGGFNRDRFNRNNGYNRRPPGRRERPGRPALRGRPGQREPQVRRALRALREPREPREPRERQRLQPWCLSRQLGYSL